MGISGKGTRAQICNIQIGHKVLVRYPEKLIGYVGSAFAARGTLSVAASSALAVSESAGRQLSQVGQAYWWLWELGAQLQVWGSCPFPQVR